MIRKFILLLSICCFLIAPAAGQKLDREKKMIEGDWIVVSGELGGRKMPDEGFKDAKLIMADGHYTFQNDHGDYKLIADENPKAMDIHGVEGPNKGKTLLAIYEVNGDTLKICYDLSGKSRPHEFTTVAGTPQFLAIYKRARS